MASQSGVVSAGYTGIPSLLYIPSVRQGIVARYPDDDFVNWLDSEGAWVEGDDSQFYTAYDTPLYAKVDTTGATITNSGSATVTVVLTAPLSGGLVAHRQVRWYHSGTKYDANVYSVTTAAGVDTIILKSSNAGAPNLVCVAGDQLYAFSNAQEEGSNPPPPERWGLTTLFNLMQVFRKAGEITDIARARNTGNAFMFKDKTTQKTSLGRWDAAKTLMAHRADIGFGMLLGEMSDANFTIASPTITGERGYGLQTTRGLVPTITSYGWANNLSSLGTWTTTDMENINAAKTARRAPKKSTWMGANQAVSRTSTFLKGLNSSGVTNVFKTADNRHLDAMVETLSWGGYDTELISMNTFDNQQVLPTTDVVTKTLYDVPRGKVPTYDRNGKATGVGSYIGARYLPVIHPGIGDKKMAQVHLGALAVNPTNGVAVEQDVYETIAGLDTPQPYTMGSIQVLA